MSIVIPGCVFSAGILFYTAIVATVVGAYRRKVRLYLAFAASCLFSSLAALAYAAYYLSGSAGGAVEALRWQADAAVLTMGSLVIFIAYYTESPRLDRWYAFVVLMAIAFIASSHIMSVGTRFSEITGSGWMRMPWGERLFYVEGPVSPWNIVLRVVATLLVVWASSRLVGMYRRGQHIESAFLALYLVALLVTSVEAVLIDRGVVRTFYWTPFALLGLPMLMGYRIFMGLAYQQEEMLQARERLDRALGASDVALFEVEVATGRVYLNESWSVMMGRERAPTETSVEELLEQTYPEERERIWGAVRAALRGEAEGYEHEHRVRTASGDWIWVLSRARIVERDANGRVVRMAGTNVDITERKRAEQRIQYLATRDALTNLANRAMFADRLESVLRGADGHPGGLAVLSIGLDRFTTINDSRGHHAGDRVLQTLAARIAACAGEHDAVGRPGGDEFLVLLLRMKEPGDALRAAEMVRDAIAAPVDVDGHGVVITASVGIAMHPEDGEVAGILLRNADTALHHAKEAGGNAVQFYAERMNVAVQARFETELALRRALEHGEFVVHFQPQVELATGKVVAQEALLRWQHREQGLLLPGRFLPIAEENGLILELGEVVLREACRHAAQWTRAAAPGTRVGVNVSARQFRHPGFLDMVRRVLDEAGLEARLLELEIVENSIVDHEPETIATLQALRAMGVELAIDDFGTGYSSLSYLRRLPINTVKIDQSFVADLPASTQSTAIVRAVLSLAHGLGLKVVAEGVETRAQLDFLRLLGCDSAQGYYLARPGPARELFFDLREQVVVPLRDEAAQ